MKSCSRLVLAALSLGLPASAVAQDVTLPQRQNSVRFAVIGDAGTGDKSQYAVAEQISEGELQDVIGQLPAEFHDLWQRPF